MEEEKNLRMSQPGQKAPLKCKIYIAVEGWILYVSGLNPEVQEEDVLDLFSDFGKVKSLHLNLDRRTGATKGYALIEYPDFDSASSALSDVNNKEFFGKTLKVDFAFRTPD